MCQMSCTYGTNLGKILYQPHLRSISEQRSPTNQMGRRPEVSQRQLDGSRTDQSQMERAKGNLCPAVAAYRLMKCVVVRPCLLIVYLIIERYLTITGYFLNHKFAYAVPAQKFADPKGMLNNILILLYWSTWGLLKIILFQVPQICVKYLKLSNI